MGVLPCQGPTWEPDSVMVEKAEGGLLWGACWALLGRGRLHSLHCTGSGSLAQVSSRVRHNSALLVLGLLRNEIREAASVSVLHPFSLWAARPTSFLCHMSSTMDLMALAYNFQCFPICDYI